MSLWDGIFGRRKVKLSDPAGWNLDFGTHAGKSVTPDSAMQLATAWACVRLRSRVVGALPSMLYERGAGSERSANRDHWVYRLIHDSPNADQSPFEFWSGQVACVDLHGNAYAEKIMGVGDKVDALEPMRPEFTQVKRNVQGAKVFDYDPPRGARRTLNSDQVLHLKGFTVGGDVGLSAIGYGRQTLGLSLAADETAARTFANGLQVSGFLEMEQAKVDKQQRKDLMDLFDRFAGSSRSGKVMPLEKGWKFVPLSMNPGDAQLLQSRAFNVEEICRWFDVPPILIGHSSQGQTMWGSGIEQIMLGWLTLSLDPFLTSIEQAVWKQIIPVRVRPRLFTEYKREGLLRADAQGRAELYSKLFQVAAMSPNIIADKENLPRFEGGDQRFVNATYVPIDQAGKRPTQPAPGEPI